MVNIQNFTDKKKPKRKKTEINCKSLLIRGSLVQVQSGEQRGQGFQDLKTETLFHWTQNWTHNSRSKYFQIAGFERVLI
jgi:hypothetical protein